MRRALRHLRLAVAVAVAGCSTAPAPASPSSVVTPVPSVSALASTPATAPVPSSVESAGPSTGSSEPPPTATSPAATAGAGSWRTVVPPLAVPAAYLDFGFAGNGDLLVVGTDLITDPKLSLWIARYTPDGTQTSRKNVDRRIGLLNMDWIDVDASDDTVVFLERQADTTFITRRVSAATGVTVKSVELQGDVQRIAIDDGGRMFATTPTYSTDNVHRPCLLDLLGAGGGIAGGVDHFLEPCETRFSAVTGPVRFIAPYEIAVARSGHLVFIDEDQDEAGYRIGLRLVVVTRAWSFVRAWDLPFEWAATDPAYGVIFSSLVLAATSDDEVFLGETLATADGSRSDGYRIRHFDTNGDLVETLGKGGSQDGITWPSRPAVDGADRLWVIDLDTATRSYSIKVRD